MNVLRRLYGLCKRYDIDTAGKSPPELWREIHEAERWKKETIANRMGVVNEDEATEAYFEILRDTHIGRSLGAKVKNYEIYFNGKTYHVLEGTSITNNQIFAGKGQNRAIDDSYRLEKRYGVPASEWVKVKGIAIIDVDGKGEKAEIHWYEAIGHGKEEMKIKEWLT